MPDPTIGLTVHEVAAKLLEPAVPEEIQETQPEVEPSEEVENTIETSEEVVEETEVSAETEEPQEAEVDEYVTGINDWVKDGSNLDQIKVPTKVNGVEGEVSIAEAIAAHQIREASEQRLNTLKAKQAEFEEEKSQLVSSYNEQLTQAANLVSALEKRLVGEAEQINWQELRDTDPAEYAAKRLDFENKAKEITQSKAAITQEHQAKLNETFQGMVQRESERLVERIPAWSDESLAQQEKSEIRDYLLNNGFSELEIDGKQDANGNVQQIGLVKASAIEMARKAMLYDRGEKAVEITKKKVKKLPKVTKPGKPISSQEVDSEKVQKMHSRLKKSGRIEDAAAIIKQRMFGG